jgi:hypothetical protein
VFSINKRIVFCISIEILNQYNDQEPQINQPDTLTVIISSEFIVLEKRAKLAT